MANRNGLGSIMYLTVAPILSPISRDGSVPTKCVLHPMVSWEPDGTGQVSRNLLYFPLSRLPNCQWVSLDFGVTVGSRTLARPPAPPQPRNSLPPHAEMLQCWWGLPLPDSKELMVLQCGRYELTHPLRCMRLTACLQPHTSRMLRPLVLEGSVLLLRCQSQGDQGQATKQSPAYLEIPIKDGCTQKVV